MIDKIVAVTLLSAPTKCIWHKDHKMRSQMNTLVISPYGSAKTTMSRYIEKLELGIRLGKYTEAGLLGTISKNGGIKHPDVIRGAGKTIMVDEFQNIPTYLRDNLLNLLEEQLAERSLGFEAPQMDIREDFWGIKTVGGSFQINVRASYLIHTMSLHRRRTADLALLSRCFPVALGFNLEDAEDIIMGRRTFNFEWVEPLQEQFKNVEMVAKNSTIEGVWNLVKDLCLKYKIEEAGHALRAHGDLMRILNVLSILEGEKQVEFYEEIEAYARIYLMSVVGSELGYREHAILSHISKNEEVKIKDLGNKFEEYTDQQIIKSLNMLIEKGLIEKTRTGKLKVT